MPTELNLNISNARGGFRIFGLAYFTSKNSINPKLIFKENEFEYKCIFSSIASYNEIKKVDIRKGISNFLVLDINQFVFAAEILTNSKIKDAITYLHNKGCPLTEEAKKYI